MEHLGGHFIVVLRWVFNIWLALSCFAFCDYPKRIISLNPYITDEIYLLKADKRLIACTTYCKAKDKERIGSLINIDIEKIISLKPDLVLAGGLQNKEQIEKLKNLGINVFCFEYPKNFSSLCEQFKKLGGLIGKRKEAERIIKDAEKKIGLIKKKVENKTKPRVIVQIGANPLWVAGKNSLINEFIELGGGINIGPPDNAPYNIEEVIKDNPDVILIMEMGIIGEKERKNWERFKNINAVLKNRIYFIDAYEFGSPNPRSFPKTLEKIAKMLKID